MTGTQGSIDPEKKPLCIAQCASRMYAQRLARLVLRTVTPGLGQNSALGLLTWP